MKKKYLKKTAVILLSASLTTGLCTGAWAEESYSKELESTLEDDESTDDDEQNIEGNKDGEFPGEPPEGMPPEKPDGDQGGTPPEKPDGDGAPMGMPPGGAGDQGGTPPEKPDGKGAPDGMAPGGNGDQGGTPPEKPDGEGAPDGMPGGNGGPGGPGGAPGGNAADIEYRAGTEISTGETQDGQSYSGTESDQNALLITSADEVSITNPTVTKTGNSDGGDSCNFYGLNAAVLVKDGSSVNITGGTITSDASGANGVFCYGGNGGQNGAEGDGTTVTIRDTEITTTGSGSGGIMTTGGGVTNAYNLTVTTSGQSSAPIRTDRGGGTVNVDGGTYTSNGLGSPAIYSTADINVSNAELISNLSEGVCIEGLNSITLTDCDLTANNTKCNGNATFMDTIMIYQSMSGDADSGTSHFTMTGGSLTSKNGHVFHVTNTNAVITLDNVEVVNEDAENTLISVCDDGWNGGNNTASLKANAQKLSGAVLVGDNSTLALELTNGSSLEGYVDGKITNAKGETVSSEVGTVSVTLDESSTWTLTGDSYVTEFNGSAANVISNGYTLYVNGTALAGTN